MAVCLQTDMGIRSVAAFAWTPLMQMFDTTQDKQLLKDKVYPCTLPASVEDGRALLR